MNILRVKKRIEHRIAELTGNIHRGFGGYAERQQLLWVLEMLEDIDNVKKG